MQHVVLQNWLCIPKAKNHNYSRSCRGESESEKRQEKGCQLYLFSPYCVQGLYLQSEVGQQNMYAFLAFKYLQGAILIPI